MPGYDIQKLLQETLAPSARLGLQTIVVGVGVGLAPSALSLRFVSRVLFRFLAFSAVIICNIDRFVKTS